MPVRIGEDSDWEKISVGNISYFDGGGAGNLHALGNSLAIKSNGTFWGWGDNTIGQLGLNSIGDVIADEYGWVVKEPTQISPSNDWESVVSSRSASIALKKDGSLWEFGGEFSIAGYPERTVREPIRVESNIKWENISAGGMSFFSEIDVRYSYINALAADGSLWAWGSNIDGAISSESSIAVYSKPTQISFSSLISSKIEKYYEINTEDDFWRNLYTSNSLQLRTKDGNLGIWVGLDTITTLTEPQEIIKDVKSVSVNEHQTLVLDNDGYIWTIGVYNWWNYDSFNGSEHVRKLGARNDWKIIEAGFGASFAITTGGDLYAWGDNTYGQLANGESIFEIIPVNQPPSILSKQTQFKMEDDEKFVYQMVTEDFENGTLVYTFESLPEWMRWDTETKTLTGDPTRQDGGIYSFTITVSDESASVTQDVDIEVNVNNSPPTDVLISQTTLSENISTESSYEVATLSTIDSDEEELFTYSIVGGEDKDLFYIQDDRLWLNEGVIIDYEEKGEFDLEIESADRFFKAVVKTITIEVTNVNEPPVLGRTKAVVLRQDNSFVEFSVETTDMDTSADELVLVLHIPDFVEKESDKFQIKTVANSKVVTLDRDGLSPGNYIVKLSLSDGEFSVEGYVELTVEPSTKIVTENDEGTKNWRSSFHINALLAIFLIMLFARKIDCSFSTGKRCKILFR